MRRGHGWIAAGLMVVGAGASARGQEPAPPAPLIARQQARLNLAGAERILAAARGQAGSMGLKVNIAVVDDGGHPLAFARMDGARPGSAYTALTKATSAAIMRGPTGPQPVGAAEPDVWLNLSLQHAAAVSGAKVTTLKGGIPVVVDGQVIGAVGVGGGTGDQDAVIATAGVAALTKAIAEAEAAGH